MLGARGLNFLILFLGCAAQGSAQSAFDSLKIKLPKHYFQTVISVDGYRKPERNLDTAKNIGKRLQTYGIKQTTFSFYSPLVTEDKYLADSTIQNTHLLLTGTIMSLRPQFAGVSDHNLVKAGIGLRYIYNTGKKGIWFFDISPFITKDVTYASQAYYRLASAIIYSRNPSEKFAWRVGAIKSFQWGNRLYLPFVGLRFGALNKVHLSIQFPRYLSLNIPVGAHSFFSYYGMAQGGMYNFSNADSLYPVKTERTFQFARREMNHGFRYDYRGTKWFGCYVALGISSRNNITFYSERANRVRKALNYDTYFFTTKAPATLYLNLGLVFKFGTARSSFNNKNLMEAQDLMNAPSGNYGNNLRNLNAVKQNKLNLSDVQELVDYSDF